MTIANSNLLWIDCLIKIKLFYILFLVRNIWMSMWKCASLDILSWQSDTKTFMKQSSKGETFHRGPVKILLLLDVLGSFIKYLLYSGVYIKFLWPCCYLVKNLFQQLFWNTCLILGIRDRRKLIVRILLFGIFIWLISHHLFIVLFILLNKLFLHLFNLLLCQHPFLNALLRVKIENRRTIFDFLIHFRLGEKWLILLIMAEPSITYNINKNIFLKLLFISDSHLHTAIQNIWLIGINVNDRGSYDFGNLCAIVCWSGLLWRCCKPNLVIHHNVDDSTCCIVDQSLKLQWLIHNSLASHCSITMN